jgi:hypothetical protein
MLAGDASTTQAEASLAPLDPKLTIDRPAGHQTGPITRIAKVFGAGAMVAGMLALSVSGGAAAERGTVERGTVKPNALLGRVPASIDVPPTTDGYAALAVSPTGLGAWFLQANGRVTASGDAIGHRDTPTNQVLEPAADIAAASDAGYWVVTKWGQVIARGDAARLGSKLLPLGARSIVAIASSPEGRGYWLVTNDGVVYPFGRAGFFGDARRAPRPRDIVDIASTESGDGYYLVSRNGRVFAYGDAREHGSPAGFIGDDVVGIAADADGTGYWIGLDTGVVLAYRAGGNRAGFAPSSAIEAVAITSRPGRSFWTLQGNRGVDHMHPFLVCTRSHESSHTAPAYDDGYAAINPSGKYRGAYQFSRSTWDSTARHALRPDLVGVDPAAASMIDQDMLALSLYAWQGADPWLGRCAGL